MVHGQCGDGKHHDSGVRKADAWEHSHRSTREERPGNTDGGCIHPAAAMCHAHLWPFVSSGTILWKSQEVEAGRGKAGTGPWSLG